MEQEILHEIKLLRSEFGGMREDIGTLKSDVSEFKSGVSVLKKDMVFVKGEIIVLHKKCDDNYTLAQRANILLEKLEGDVRQIAEGVIENRCLNGTVCSYGERISNLEWRVDMHGKAIKKAI